MMESPSWFVVVASVSAATLLAMLVWAFWRAHRRRVAALDVRADNLQGGVAASCERLDSLLAAAAHALSQPLTALHGTLELALLSSTIPAAAHPVLEDALKQVQATMGLTRLIREFACAEASGKSARATSLATLLEEMQEDLEALAQLQGIRLVLQGQAFSSVLANPADLRRAIHYVVEYALDRSPAGGLVQITSVQETSAASIVITDQGPRIPARDLPHWFEPFYGGHNGASAKRDALRLAIVARTCASYGGSASAMNIVSGGVRFVLRLPLS